MSIVDAHLHVWRTGDGFPIKIRARIPELDRDFGWRAQQQTLDDADVEAVVMVSAALDSRETEALLAIAGRSSRHARVIGYIDADVDDPVRLFERWSAHPAFVGLRFPLTVVDEGWIGSRRARAIMEALSASGLIAQILAAPEHLIACARAMSDFPSLTCVIDHAANPPANGDLTTWEKGLSLIAEHDRAWCKLSNFQASGGAAPDSIRRAVLFASAVHLFGTGRLIAGSNWPVSSLVGAYGATFDLLRALCHEARLGTSATDALLSDNAKRLFGISG